MSEDSAPPGSAKPRPHSSAWHLATVWLLAIVGGCTIGAVGAGFRISLEGFVDLRGRLVERTWQWPAWGWLIPVVGVAVTVAVARWLVERFAPAASGSGVQHVEAVMRGQVKLPATAVLPVKFIGGELALGSGMVLGREGPVVQMGSTVGSIMGRLCRLKENATRDLQAAVAGAGLATAFNAPIGGAVFVFEELARQFSLRLVVMTLTACATAITVLRLIEGDQPDFIFHAPDSSPIADLPVYLVLGGLTGVIGVVYNKLIVGGLEIFDAAARLPIEARAAMVGGVVGLIAWMEPALVGGGERQVQQVLDAQWTVAGLAVLFAVRSLLGPFCYSAGTPGGVFAPLLLVGASFGALLGGLLHQVWPAAPEPAALAVVGMAAFFAAVVRAPLTGVMLIVEMTASTRLIVPLLLATAVATVVPTLFGNEPIYEELLRRMLRQPRGGRRDAADRGDRHPATTEAAARQ